MTDDLTAAFQEEVEVVDCGDAIDFLVSRAGLADLVLLGHVGEERVPCLQTLVAVLEVTERKGGESR